MQSLGSEERGVGLKGWLTGPKRTGSKVGTQGLEILDRHRIAVLPLSNVSPDPQDEYFADGMTDEVISTVSKIEGLEVISRTSIMQYKKTARAIRDVSRELGVGTILEGSVRKAGNKLRVTVQIIDAVKDKHLWSNSYDRELRDVFAIQSDIAENVADSLKLQLLGETRAQIKKKATEDVDAYSLYLKGRFYWNERNPSSVKKAMQYFESAITRDSKFAMPYVGLADCYLILMDQGMSDPDEARVKAKGLLETALRLDSGLAEAHTSLANFLENDWDWSGAKARYLRSIELNPNYATTHQWYSILLAFTGRHEEALGEIIIAHRLDPISPVVNANLGLRLAEIGRADEGVEYLKKSVELEPDYGQGHTHLGAVYISQSKYDMGIPELKRGLEIMGTTWNKAFLAYAYAMSGDRWKAEELLSEIEQASTEGFVPSAAKAVVYYALGDKNKAFQLVEKALEERSTGLPYVGILPIFHNIQSDRRFRSLLNRVISP